MSYANFVLHPIPRYLTVRKVCVTKQGAVYQLDGTRHISASCVRSCVLEVAVSRFCEELKVEEIFHS